MHRVSLPLHFSLPPPFPLNNPPTLFGLPSSIRHPWLCVWFGVQPRGGRETGWVAGAEDCRMRTAHLPGLTLLVSFYHIWYCGVGIVVLVLWCWYFRIELVSAAL